MANTVQLTICRDSSNDLDINALGISDRREAVIHRTERANFFRDLQDLVPENAAQFANFLSIQVTITAENWASWLAVYEIEEETNPEIYEYIAADLAG